MPQVIYVQFANPEQYPPLEHGSNIFVKNGWQCTFLGRCSELQGQIAFKPLVGRRVVFLPRWTRRLSAKFEFAVYFLWVSIKVMVLKPDLIYLSDALATPIGVLLERLGYPIVYHEHDTPDGRQHGGLRRLRKKLFRRALVSVVPNSRRIASEKLEPADLVVVRNFPSVEEIKTIQPAHHEHLVICYFGTMVPSRLPVSFFDHLAESDQRIDVKLMGYDTIENRGYVETLCRQFEDCENLNFEFLGAFPRMAMLAMASQTDVGLLLFSNLDDVNEGAMAGASNKIGDYLASGLPVLCRSTPEFEELKTRLKGIYTFSDDQEIFTLLETLKKKYASPELRKDLQHQLAQQYNYELEFAPVFRRIVKSVLP